MRGECAICGRGAEFPRASARCLPDFFTSLFIALTGFPHGVFLPPAQCKGLPSRLIQPHSPLRIASRLVCLAPSCSCAGRISLNSFVYCRASYFSSFVSCFGNTLQGDAREFYLSLSLNSAIIYFHYRANYFHPGANAVLSHGSRDS